MQHRRVGNSGLTVSRLGLGTLTWGRDTHLEEASALLSAFVEAGGTLVDTADVYGDGDAETLLGEVFTHAVRRDAVTVACKAGVTPHTQRKRNSSRAHLLHALDTSLRRLHTDYIDVWHIHAWDTKTPLEETLSACATAVQSGRVRYIGVSNFTAWQFAAFATAAQHEKLPVISHQVEYSLLERSCETEILQAAEYLQTSIFAWSPLARGVLTGKYRSGTPADSRGASAELRPFVEPHLSETNHGIIDAVATAADGLGTTPVAVALSWVRDAPGVSSAIVGARGLGQLRDSLDAEELELPHEIRRALSDAAAAHSSSSMVSSRR